MILNFIDFYPSLIGEKDGFVRVKVKVRVGDVMKLLNKI